MKFKIRCESIKEFDAAKGAYVKCGREVAVDSSQVGSLVRCPGCGNRIEVIDPTMLGSGVDAFVAGAAETNPVQPAPGPATRDPVQPAPAASSVPADSEPAIDLVTDLPELAPDEPKAAVAPAWGASPSLSSAGNSGPTGELKKETYNQTTGTILHQTRYGRQNTCHKCGTLLEDKQPVCPNCQTARRAEYVEKKDRRPFSRKGPFGFHLWLDGMTRGPSSPNEFDWLGILALAFSIILMGAGITFFVFAGIAGKIVGPLVAAVGYLLFTGLRYWGAARRDPRTPIPLLGHIVWTIVLFFVRMTKFSKVSQEKFLDRNGDEAFGDRDLAALRDLSKYRIIDLEGTSITDEGLVYLYDHRGIQYLVVRNTDVTLEGVQDLQQTIPRTWIWF